MEKYDDRPDSAKRLKSARIVRGFKNAKKAALYFGWIYETYSQHENGTRGLTSKRAEVYAKAFRVSPGWLLTGEGDGPNKDFVYTNDEFFKKASDLLLKIQKSDEDAVLRVLQSLASPKDK